MKFFLLALILIFNFQSLIKADDIRDLEIQGISVDDNALDHFSKKNWMTIKVFIPKVRKYGELPFN